MRDHSLKRRRLELMYLLWSLLFIKCFSLEFLVREYEIPINSFYYVWCLSVTMATIATVVYGRLESASIHTMLQNKGTILHIGLSLLCAISVVWTLLIANADSRTALFISAVATGLRHLFTTTNSVSSANLRKALAWILTALAIFFTAPPTGFLLFALGLLLISVIPRASELLQKAEK